MPPGMVKPAANVTVAISIATNKMMLIRSLIHLSFGGDLWERLALLPLSLKGVPIDFKIANDSNCIHACSMQIISTLYLFLL